MTAPADSGARPDAISVLLLDNDAAFRCAIRAGLESHGFVVVAEAADATSAVAAAAREQPDLALADIDLAGNGLNAVSAISRRVPTTTIVVLTASQLPSDLLASLERGASGYLIKGIPVDELAKTLRMASTGEPAISRAMVPALMDQVRSRSKRVLVLPAGPVELTNREWDVAEFLRDGLNTVSIASRLDLSPVTVRGHVSSLMKKLGVRDRAAAVWVLKVFAR